MSVYTFSQWVLFFYIYCFLGWVFESTYVSIMEHHLVNRGFLKGPFLPIYGSGALCVLIVTIPFRDNVPLMCLSGMTAATLLEYVTGAAMEKLFHVRYWDYTGKFLNINGHICLMSTLCWGAMTLLVVDVLQVFLEDLVLAVDEQVVTVVVFVLTPFLTADLVTSFRTAIHLRDILIHWERISEEMQKLEAQRRELEAALAERRREMETAISRRRQELETALDEQRRGMETALNEQKRVLETALDERKRGMETALDERKRSLETAFDERKRGLGNAPGERKRDLGFSFDERKRELETAVTQYRQELEASLVRRNRELTDKAAALQEKVSRMKVEGDLMQKMHGKSIGNLLKRNPKAVSIMNREAFAALKQSLARKTGEPADPEDAAGTADPETTVETAHMEVAAERVSDPGNRQNGTNK
ncbi:MAG: hypothetical protein LUI87_13105 [Lachnospiraceae bacterium]|nr:hypothetical protein [Lachnospiraceae bacterium]